MAHDSNAHGTHGGVGGYILVALILGVITYIEFAIVEYEIAWLSSSAVLWTLMILSVVKFVMVIMYFMHLKDDDVAYSGFFSVGMLMALGTFVAFAFLMTAPSSINYFRANVAPGGLPTAHADDETGLDEATLALIESDGYSRPQSEVMDIGRPKDQSLQVEPPAADAEYTLAEAPAAAGSDGEPDVGEPQPPAADADPTQQPDDSAAADAAADSAGGSQPNGGASTWDQALGEQVYDSNCAACHQGNGQGIPGAFPPLAGHSAEVAGVEGGRTYLIDAVLYGLQGSIQVQGQTYNGVMPAWAHLGDDQVAAVVNHIVYLGDGADALPADFAPIAPDEVAAQRDQASSAQDVHALREELPLP